MRSSNSPLCGQSKTIIKSSFSDFQLLPDLSRTRKSRVRICSERAPEPIVKNTCNRRTSSSSSSSSSGVSTATLRVLRDCRNPCQSLSRAAATEELRCLSPAEGLLYVSRRSEFCGKKKYTGSRHTHRPTRAQGDARNIQSTRKMDSQKSCVSYPFFAYFLLVLLVHANDAGALNDGRVLVASTTGKDPRE
ncbi:unnamed protein product [Trichogramma brassicae]|uniref:Uncharacterized protein n=1 Tax=Trichogramma brassicae TaxID=86971 RepID=A0A6H5I3F3_9HYME|nr:unnamed protein product [Trichogramma brassicae]